VPIATFLNGFVMAKNMEKTNNYFQGILQLRNVDESIMEYVLSQFEKHKIGIAKIQEFKNGFDIYSASNKFSRKIAHKLKNEFGGQVKESPKLFSKSKLTSKNIYRLNVLYKGPELKKGEIVKFKDKIIKVSSLTKNMIKGTDIVSGNRISVPNESVKILEPKKTIVVNVKPQVEVMHPETYQSIIPENKKRVKVNQEVQIVVYRDKIYLL